MDEAAIPGNIANKLCIEAGEGSIHFSGVSARRGDGGELVPAWARGNGNGVAAFKPGSDRAQDRVAGGVAGAVVGSQIGSGSGKTVAQIAGTLGGVFAGREIEKRVRRKTYYQVDVAMDAGGSRSVNVDTTSGISPGTRVQVQGNNLVLMR